MPDQPSPNLATSLITFHHVITRGLRVSQESLPEFIQAGFPDPSRREGFLNYLRALKIVIDGHHLTEDEVAFPFLKGWLPDVPYDRLSREHEEIVVLLSKLDEAITACESDDTLTEGLAQLQGFLRQTATIWEPHIGIEEQHFTAEGLNKLLPADEHTRIVIQASAYGREHSKPEYLVVPFVLYNLPLDIRTMMMKAMPEEVTQRLVPVVWKEQWASMQPFLLN